MTDLYIVRHGETIWSKSGQHTSVTDLDLTPAGKDEARKAGEELTREDFGLVLTSPRLRARRTAELAGFGDAEVTEDLVEWFYGDYEGRTSADIRKENPDWRIWTTDPKNGETREQVVERLNRVVKRVQESGVDKAIVFSHGHASRALACVWLGWGLELGAQIPLKTGTVSILGYEKESPAIVRWNV